MPRPLRFIPLFFAGGLLVLSLIGASPAARGTASTTSARALPSAADAIPAIALHFCNSEYGGYCGHIERKLDPTGGVPGTIDIGFELYPRYDRSRPALGTILTEEGGPGYSSTGSRDGYVRLFEPLRDRRDILIVDLRGTGTSGVIDCEPLQNLAYPTQASLAACGRKLGRTADLYGTKLAADDVVAVLNTLNVAKIDYYGDSYGTFFGQVFSQRHPDRVRTIVLDSAYPVTETSPWFPTEWATAVRSFDLVCERSPACRSLGGRSMARITALLDRLRRAPVSGYAHDGEGDLVYARADPQELYNIMINGGYSPPTYRDLDAAARALLDDGESLPLLRLSAEATPQSGGGGIEGAEAFSEGLYVAVVCSDYPQLFDLFAPHNVRLAQLRAGIAAEQRTDPKVYAPFTLGEYLSFTEVEEADLCLDWPVPSHHHPTEPPVPPNAIFPRAPTLVLSGEVDTITSPEEGRQTAAQFPNATQVLVANTGHETAIGDAGYFIAPRGADITRCTSLIVLHFVATQSLGDTSCARHVRAIRTVRRFVTSVTQVVPAEPLSGNCGTHDDLQVASATVETAGDVIARYYESTGGTGAGLRGGSFAFEQYGDGYRFHLDRVRWTNDLAVSGIVTWDQYTGEIVADLRLYRPGHATGRALLRWNERANDARVTIRALIDRHLVVAFRPAA